VNCASVISNMFSVVFCLFFSVSKQLMQDLFVIIGSLSCWKWLTCVNLTPLRCLSDAVSGTLMKTNISVVNIICESLLHLFSVMI